MTLRLFMDNALVASCTHRYQHHHWILGVDCQLMCRQNRHRGRWWARYWHAAALREATVQARKPGSLPGSHRSHMKAFEGKAPRRVFTQPACGRRGNRRTGRAAAMHTQMHPAGMACCMM